MNFETNRNSIIRFTTTALAVINMIIVTLGGDSIAIADDKLYVVASIIALVITVTVVAYKHNATTPLGCLIRHIYDLAKIHGAEAIYECIINALETFISDNESADSEEVEE